MKVVDSEWLQEAETCLPLSSSVSFVAALTPLSLNFLNCEMWSLDLSNVPQIEIQGQPYLGHLRELPKLYSWICGGESQDPSFFQVPQKVGCVEYHNASFTSCFVFVSQWFNKVNRHEKEPKKK